MKRTRVPQLLFQGELFYIFQLFFIILFISIAALMLEFFRINSLLSSNKGLKKGEVNLLSGSLPAPSSESTPKTNRGSDVPNAIGILESPIRFASFYNIANISNLSHGTTPISEDLLTTSASDSAASSIRVLPVMPFSKNSMSRRRTYREPTSFWFSEPPPGIPCNAKFSLYFYLSSPTSHQLTVYSPLQLYEALEDALGKADPEVMSMRNGSVLVRAASKSQSTTFENLFTG